MSELNMNDAAEMTVSDNESTMLGLNRNNLILLGLLVIQAIAVAIFYWPSSAALESGTPLLGELGSSDVKAIAITNADGDEVNLTRSSDGWVLASAGSYPATATKVDEVIDKLLAMNGNRLVTNTAGSHKRLQVADDDFNTKVELTTSDGTQTLFVGTAPSSGATHVRLSGQDETYLTSEIASWELGPQPSSWVETLYFETPTDEVVALTLENTNGTFEFTRENADSPWTLADLADDEVLDETAVNTLLGRVVNIRMVEPLGQTAEADYGMDTPQATATLTSRNAEGNEATHTIQIGAKNEETENYVLKSSESAFFVTVSAFTGDELVNKVREDFMQEPEPEAAPAEGDTAGENPAPVDAAPADASGDGASNDGASNDAGDSTSDTHASDTVTNTNASGTVDTVAEPDAEAGADTSSDGGDGAEATAEPTPPAAEEGSNGE